VCLWGWLWLCVWSKDERNALAWGWAQLAFTHSSPMPHRTIWPQSCWVPTLISEISDGSLVIWESVLVVSAPSMLPSLWRWTGEEIGIRQNCDTHQAWASPGARSHTLIERMIFFPDYQIDPDLQDERLILSVCLGWHFITLTRDEHLSEFKKNSICMCKLIKLRNHRQNALGIITLYPNCSICGFAD
jgi:hypothetical protein